MRIEVESSTDRWVGLALVFAPDDLDRVIANLVVMKSNPDQHFHVTTTGSEGPFVDLEICVDAAQSPNATLLGFAIAPDSDPGREDGD